MCSKYRPHNDVNNYTDLKIHASNNVLLSILIL